MKVTCPKCCASIRAVVTAVGPDRFRWGTNDLPSLIGKCLAWRDPVNAEAANRMSCSTIEAAVIDALAPKDLRAK
jgi:hypothetical protein